MIMTLLFLTRVKEKNLKHLANVYASMEASKAAGILSQLNSETGAKVMASMPSRKSAKILAEIDPATAASISEQIKKLEFVNKTSEEAFKQRNLKKLAAIYQDMEAGNTLSIMRKMDYDTAVNILSYMDEKKTS